MNKIIAIVLLALSLVGCGDGNGDGTRVRFLNAATSGVYTLASDDRTIGVVAPGTIGSYVDLEDGPVNIRILRTSDGVEVARFSSDLNGDLEYTVAAVDGAGGTVNPLIVVDDNDDASFGNFRVRAVHTDPSLGAMDIYILRNGVPLSGQQPTFAGMIYGDSSEYDQIDQNEYIVYVTPSSSQNILAATSLSRFDNLETWSVFVMDNGAAPALLVVRDDSTL